MKKEILERYERNANDEIIINISTDKIEDLYNNFDRRSPFLKKDLSEDFVTYLIDCVSEIDQQKFVIHINFETPTQTSSLSRIKNSIHNFFLYMKELETKQMRSRAKTSGILLCVGAVLAFIALLMNTSTLVNENLFLGVIAEGLSVATWVALWEALATFLIRWMPSRKKIFLYEQIAQADVVICSELKK